MRPIANAVVQAGLIDDSVLDEMARWGIHITAVPDQGILSNAQSVVDHIREAIEGEDQVRIDETDLDILRRYLDRKQQKTGRLILRDEDKHQTTMKVNFCLTEMGEYAIPWTDGEVPTLLINGESHLKWNDGEKERDIYFFSLRELYYGSRKAFVVCAPSHEDTHETTR